MELPRTSKEDIEDEEPISIVAKVVDSRVFDDGNEMYYLRDVRGEETRLKIWSSETDQYEIETEKWYLFQDAEGDTYSDPMLGSNRGKMEAVKIDGPPEFAETTDEYDFVESVEGDILAFDIETISLVPEAEMDLDNSDHVSLLCIGVGYSPEVGVPGYSEVLFRNGTTDRDEADLIREFCEYVENRYPSSLLMFKGKDFDLTHLRGRASRVTDDDDLRDRVDAVFAASEIRNLSPAGRLEDNADVPSTHWDIYSHSLDPTEWRRDHPNYDGELDASEVTNKDIPYFGERYLQLQEEDDDDRETRALRELIRRYTESDISPLFGLV